MDIVHRSADDFENVFERVAKRSVHSVMTSLKPTGRDATREPSLPLKPSQRRISNPILGMRGRFGLFPERENHERESV